MQRIVSTYVYVNHKLTAGHLDDILRARMTGVEIFCASGHFDYRANEAVRLLADWFEEHPLKLHALHSPTSRDRMPTRESGVPISISDTERTRRLDAVDEVKRVLEVAERIPFRFLVQHLGASREGMDQRRLDAAFSSLEHLTVFAKQRGVTIALENTPGELASPATLRHFVADTRLTDLRLCFDTGHAHMEDGIERSYETMRDLVVTAHVHDNHGERDEHLPPFEGSIDWPATLKAFAHAPAADGALPMVVELKENVVHGHPVDKAVTVFDRFEEVAAAAKA